MSSKWKNQLAMKNKLNAGVSVLDKKQIFTSTINKKINKHHHMYKWYDKTKNRQTYKLTDRQVDIKSIYHKKWDKIPSYVSHAKAVIQNW